jgi:hypothetical protein
MDDSARGIATAALTLQSDLLKALVRKALLTRAEALAIADGSSLCSPSLGERMRPTSTGSSARFPSRQGCYRHGHARRQDSLAGKDALARLIPGLRWRAYDMRGVLSG